MRIFSLFLWALCMVLFSLPVWADDDHVEDDFGIWTPVILQLHAPDPHDRWYATLTPQPRLKDNATAMDQFLLVPGVGYEVNKHLSVEAGYGWVPNFRDRQLDTEHRLWQGIWLRKNFDRLKMFDRLRIEERFLPGVDNASVRVRNMLGGRYYLGEDRRWYLVSFDELFWNVSNHKPGPEGGFNQNRLFMGVGRDIGQRMKIEGGYNMVFVNAAAPANDRLSHLLMVQVFYTLR